MRSSSCASASSASAGRRKKEVGAKIAVTPAPAAAQMCATSANIPENSASTGEPTTMTRPSASITRRSGALSAVSTPDGWRMSARRALRRSSATSRTVVSGGNSRNQWRHGTHLREGGSPAVRSDSR